MLQQVRSAVTFASHLPRYREILSILFKYGFADVLKLVALQQLLGFEEATMTKHEKGILSKPLPERLRLALEELGPTFVKFGQIVSSRRDLINVSYYEELCLLQDRVPAYPFKEVVATVEAELGAPLKKLFASFEEVPHGCASIAQVHEATLCDGTRVAVKVQRPHITQVIQQDLAILTDLAAFLENHVPDIRGLNPQKVIEEFSATLLKELDFTNEAANAERFAKQFEEETSIVVPAIYRKFSSHKVLTMDFVEGMRINDLRSIKRYHLSSPAVAQKITELIYRQIFTYGFFHADPHPGNMVLLSNGSIGLYDYGMMGTLSMQFRQSIAMLITGLAKKNHRQVMHALLEMSEEGTVEDTTNFLAEVEEFSHQNLAGALADIQLGKVLNQLLELLRKSHLRMKGSFYLGIKALTQVEAIGRELDPTLNFIMLGKPYAIELMHERYRPRRMFTILSRIFTDSIDLLEELPHDVRLFYTRLKRGQLQIPLEHRIAPEGIEPLRQTLDSVFNRLVNALLAASLLIASSILIHSGLPPKIGGVPLFGLLGFLIGFAMCLRLAFSIWKHGGL